MLIISIHTIKYLYLGAVTIILAFGNIQIIG
jgi:hypothetical protein